MESKQRHGCVTTWLILIILANAILFIPYFFMGDTVSKNLPGSIPQPMMKALVIVGIANLISSIMLFQWKKWAFWTFAGTSLIALGIELFFGLGLGVSVLWFTGAVILYGISQIKRNGITTWENLE